MSQEMIWESFDAIFKTVHRQGRRIEELEARIADLERRLSANTPASQRLIFAPTEVERLGHTTPTGEVVVDEEMKSRIFVISAGGDAASEAERILRQAEALEKRDAKGETP